MNYSFIIPVFNRPEEIGELLQSFLELKGEIPFEIVIVEDGSSLSSETVIEEFRSELNISYYNKSNSGPGKSRNFGMRKAKGDYFIILDSDCLLPPQYLLVVDEFLKKSFVDCFGGPDAAHASFNNLQKGINFAMTSSISTGGVRGGKGARTDFQPRSFNMGLSKEAFFETKGFGNIHPGEDPDLVLRLRKLGYETALISDAYVYHKRRISWPKFFNQVYKFGLARPILNKWHPNSAKATYWFPSLFTAGLMIAIFLAIFGNVWPITIYGFYFFLIFLSALLNEKNLIIAFYAIFAVLIQFIGYGIGFFNSTINIGILNKRPEKQYPKLFFDNV